MQEVLILAPVGEACPAHTQVLHQSQVLDLVADEEVVKLAFGEIEERVTGKAPSAPPTPSFQAAAASAVFLRGRVLVSTDETIPKFTKAARNLTGNSGLKGFLLSPL